MLRAQIHRQPVDIDFTLRRVFGKKTFRYETVLQTCVDPGFVERTTKYAICSPLQREVILAALEGHDVFLQAATSFGKSLCFQLPAVISHGGTQLAFSPTACPS